MSETHTNGQNGSLRLKTGLAEMLKGGVIMDVVTADQAKIAEDAGATSVMALERVPADIRAEGAKRLAKRGPPARLAVLPQGPLTIPYLA